MWALVALVVILTVYLLPTLVGRRTVWGQSREEDRYSAQLRLLAIDPSREGSQACATEARAHLFQYQPEVRAMNRPAVRGVKSLRTERELARATQVHERARERRRAAAKQRAIVAAVLAGTVAGLLLVGAFTALPSWPAAIPTVLLGLAMVASARTAQAEKRANARERGRIEDLSRELARLGGSSRSIPTPSRSSAPSLTSQQPTSMQTPDAEQAVPASAAVEEGAAEEGAPEEGPEAPQERPADTLVEDAAAAEGGDRPEVGVDETVVVDAEARPAEESVKAERSLPAETVSAAKLARHAEPSTSTPPQGWTPVRVPAPSYVLAANARRRIIAELETPELPSAPVPSRPTHVRTYAPVKEETGPLRMPIDLDEILQRRRQVAS